MVVCESQNIEYKVICKEEHLKEICGMSNAGNVGANAGNVGANAGNVGVNAENVGVKSEGKAQNANCRRSRIIDSMKTTSSITAKELSDMLFVSTRTIERDIAWLIDNHFISRSGADKNGRWIVLKELR